MRPRRIISSTSLRENQRTAMRSSSMLCGSPAVSSVATINGHLLGHKAGAGIKRRPAFSISSRDIRSPPSIRAAPPSEAVSPGSSRPAGSSHRYCRAGRRYWRTSRTRLRSSTAIMTADPPCCTMARRFRIRPDRWRGLLSCGIRKSEFFFRGNEFHVCVGLPR